MFSSSNKFVIFVSTDCSFGKMTYCLNPNFILNFCADVVLQSIINCMLCSYHVTYVFQSESTYNSCLNVKELLARNRCEI